MPSWLFSASDTLPATATSQRLTKIDATDRTPGFNPAAMRRSMPRMNASAAARYWSSENNSVTLTGMPTKIASSVAGSPSLVPGILIRRLGRCARACRSLASATVDSVSCASGETSSDTPTVHAACLVVNRSEQIRSLGDVLQCQVEEELLSR